MAGFRDLRTFLDDLEERGKLYRFSDPVDKDRELLPLFRVQQRGVPASDRKVFLFDNIRSASTDRYDMSVAAGVYGASEEIVALGLGCETYHDILETWHRAVANPIEPKIVESGPVQEEVHVGDDLLACGLDAFPVPVEEPGFSQVIRLGMPIISRDPETGWRNAGAYNAFLRDRDRLVTGAGPTRHIMRHWRAAKERGEDLPIAIVIGAPTHIMFAASTVIPPGADEMAVAGGLAGEPIEMVRCKTVPLEVPAHAEIVVEAMMSTETVEPRLGFGEYPGYINPEQNLVPIAKVTAITHRRNAIFTPVLVGFPPVESTTISVCCLSANLYHNLRYAAGLPVDEVYIAEMGGASCFCVVRLQKGVRANTWQILHAVSGFWPSAKYVVLVDHDIDTRDPEILVWALSWRVRPERDIAIVAGRNVGLDPSFGRTGSSRGTTHRPDDPREYFRVLIDATTKGPYPPVALPQREYMERALEIWRSRPDLPEPALKSPWYGYDLGFWNDEEQQLADMMAAGDYKAVGRITAEQQKSTDEVR